MIVIIIMTYDSNYYYDVNDIQIDLILARFNEYVLTMLEKNLAVKFTVAAYTL